MQLLSHRMFKPKLLLPTLGLAALTALLWAVVLAGRSLPWQADRAWVLTFTITFVLAAAWWWRYLRVVLRFAVDGESNWLLAAACVGVPFLVIATATVMAIYLSDGLNDIVARPEWKVATVAFAAMLTLLVTSLQQASVLRLEHGTTGFWDAARTVLSKYSGIAGWGSITLIGLLQATAGVAPIGDDIWHFSMVSDAVLAGRPYPVPTVDPHLQRAGMGSTYPALPFMPALIALSFNLFGRNLVGIAMPTVVATALFPLAMYAVCRRLTGSPLVAYAATLLLYLFPIYQIHILGSPEPDTIFVVLLLLVAWLSIRANESRSTRHWVGMGFTMGLATLTRPEGVFYAVALFLTFLLVHHRRPGYWLAAAVWMAVVAPFSLLHQSLTGDLWPRTLGAKMVGWENFEGNLAMLKWPAIDWYGQALGVGEVIPLAGLFVIFLMAVVGALAILREKLPLVWIPAAGIGNVLMGFVTHPMVMASYSPVEFLRHDSLGFPFAAISVAYGVVVCARLLSRFPQGWRRLVPVAALLLVASGAYYNCAHLALPERYFGGSASLLWTGSSYLLTDLLSHPVELQATDDSRPGEQVRADLFGQVEEFSLRRVNRSEPYHWASLLAALFGLTYLASSVRGTVPLHSRPTGPTLRRTAFGQPESPS